LEFYQIDIPLSATVVRLERRAGELGITAGLQDRVIQVYEGLAFMDFDRRASASCGLPCYHYERLDPALLPPVYVAYHVSMASHRDLPSAIRDRFNRGEALVVDAMSHFAALAAEGRDAIVAGDHDRLSALINENFDTRRRIYNLAPCKSRRWRRRATARQREVRGSAARSSAPIG